MSLPTWFQILELNIGFKNSSVDLIWKGEIESDMSTVSEITAKSDAFEIQTKDS